MFLFHRVCIIIQTPLMVMSCIEICSPQWIIKLLKRSNALFLNSYISGELIFHFLVSPVVLVFLFPLFLVFLFLLVLFVLVQLEAVPPLKIEMVFCCFDCKLQTLVKADFVQQFSRIGHYINNFGLKFKAFPWELQYSSGLECMRVPFGPFHFQQT